MCVRGVPMTKRTARDGARAKPCVKHEIARHAHGYCGATARSVGSNSWVEGIVGEPLTCDGVSERLVRLAICEVALIGGRSPFCLRRSPMIAIAARGRLLVNIEVPSMVRQPWSM